MIRLRIFVFLFIFISQARADLVEMAVLSGTETTAVSTPTDLNQPGPLAMKWSASEFDASFFDHSTSSFAHELKVKVSGDYRVSFTIPLVLNDTSSNRRAVLAEVYVNGTPVSHGRMSSSYIRQASSHNESSLHGVFLLDGLNANDNISIFLDQDVTAGDITTPGAQLFVEFIDPSRSIFSATAKQTTSSTNLNQSTAFGLEWTETVKDSDFAHSDSSSPENITFNTSGSYFVFINIPLETTCGSTRRAPKALVRLNGVTVDGGVAAQGYIRCSQGHARSSLHWSGLLDSVTAGQVLTVFTQAETTRTESVIVPASRDASIFIEKVDATTEYISLRGTQLLTGNNWNPSAAGSEVQWTTQDVIDASTFTHSTSSNSHKVAVDVDGGYFVSYTDYLTSTVQRANPIARIKINNSIQTSAVCKTHYNRNQDNHRETSCSLTHFFPSLVAGDEISVELATEAASGTVDDLGSARLVVAKVSDGTPPNCNGIVDCTPDLVLHVDASDFNSVLDSSSRDANDLSFNGNAAEWKDISGSADAHNLIQTTASRQPAFDTTNKLMQFDGINDFFPVANSDELNTAPSLKERTFVLAFKTGSDVNSTQVIYEEGGTVRGMNAYISGGDLYIGFWNIANDGDGVQSFTSASTPVAADTHYYASLVLDYSNYTGGAGPDGELRGHIGGVKFTSLGTTTSLLYDHPGNIGFGAKNNGTFYHTGSSGGTGDYFGGTIFEFLLYNHAIDDTEAVDFYNYLKTKWPDPQPVTNLVLDSQYTAVNTSTPNFSWTASISNDVTDYLVALGTTPGAEDESAFASAGLVTNTSITGLSLNECTDYYASVKATDGTDESEIVTTEFLRFDGTSPSDPSALVISGSSSVTQSKSLSWTASTDNCAFSHYELGVGTSAGATDVIAYTDIGNVTSHQFTGVTPNLSTGTDYFFTLRAYDQAGNISSVINSVAWQVDTCVASDVTAPTDPAAFTNTGDGGSTTSPLHGWSASTDACGLSHYELAIGTSSGASDVVSFTNVGDVLTHKFFAISPSLSTNTDYFTSIRAVDLAGNQSNVVTGASWQLPTPGGVSSGLVLWLDASDTGTVFTDAGCSTPATDGSSIQCWADKSTSANNGTSSGTARPLWEDNEFNDEAVVSFDGSNDVIDFTNIANIRTVFIVNKSDATTFQPILGHTTSRHFYTANELLVGPTISSADLRTGSWRVDRTDVSNPTIFTQTGSFSLISVVASANVEANHLASDQKTAGRFFRGDVAEVIIYDRALSTSEITNVEDYLHGKWFSANPQAVTGLAFSSQYTANSSESPSFSWTHSTAPDLSYYEVALGTSAGANDIAGWTNIGLANTHQFLGLSLSECVDVFASVRAVDTQGLISSIVSTEFARFDGTDPINPSGLIPSGSASETQTKIISWGPGSDSCSFSHYEVAVGTTSGASDVISFTNIGDVITHQFTGVSPNLLFSTNYFTTVRSVDDAGNTSSGVSSSAWQLDSCVATDVTSPTDPSGFNLTNAATVTKSKALTWTASTDSCSFSHYEVALGTSSGASDIVGFTNIGDVLSHRFLDVSPNLSFATDYFMSVRAVDQAGNFSSVVSSAAFQLTTPGDVSAAGLLLWLDALDDATVYQNSACSTAATANDQPIGCFKDKSGSDNHAINAVGSNQPVYKTTNFSSKPAVYFNGGADQFLDFGSLSTIRTVFWVLKEDSSNPGNTAFLLGDPGGTTSHFHRASTLGAIFSSGSASANVTGGTLNKDTVLIDGTTTNMPTSEAVLSLVTTGNVTASAFSRDRTSCCGGRTWGGSLAELIIFDRALNSTEVADVENFLLSKWSISASATQWTGAVSTDWFNASNWSAGVPNQNKDCVIGDQSNDPIISAGTGVCRNIDITNGTVTLANGTSAVLGIFGNFENTGVFTQNDGDLEFRDDGVASTIQTLQSTTAIEKIRFDKTVGGSVTLSVNSLTVNDFVVDASNDFDFIIPNNRTLTVPNGITIAGGTVDVQGGGTLEIGAGQALSVTGGIMKTSGTNDAFVQSTTNKGTITRQGGAGRWAFNVSAGAVDLTGFLIDFVDVDGLNINGTADVLSLDGGQFTNLSTDFVTPVKAIQLNTSSSLTESVATNVGFNWDVANSLFSGTPGSSDNYFTIHAPACNSSVLVFDQWFGDFFDPSTKLPATEDKILDMDDGGSNCQVSMTLAASPVNLTAFTVTPFDQTNLLEWETGAEIDHLGFNVLRSDQMFSGYVQINNELIQNFKNSTTFRGKYRFEDKNLTNGQTYYYMIEDISINGTVERHGPLASTPNAALGSPPAPSAEENSIDDSPVSVDLGGGTDLIHQTQSSMRIQVVPAATNVVDASWSASHKEVFVPGYSKTLIAGEPELMTRKILIEVNTAYSSITSNEVILTSVDETASLSGKAVTPAPSWTLNATTNVLEPQYSEDAVAYSTDSLLPSSFYSVGSSSVEIGGRHYLELTVNPIMYNAFQKTMLKMTQLVLDIGLDGEIWEATVPPTTFAVAPASVEGVVRIKYDKEGLYELSFADLVSNNVEGPLDGADIGELRMFYHGVEIPIEVISSDSIFSTGDKIRFYTQFSDSVEDQFDEVVLSSLDLGSIVYADGDDPGALRILATDNTPSSLPIAPAEYNRRTYVEEENNLVIFDAPVGGIVDRFYWKRIFISAGTTPNAGARHDWTSNLSQLDADSDRPVKLTVHLRGRGAFALNPVHEINLYVNNMGTPVATQSFSGNDSYELEFEIPSDLFVTGNNNFRIEATGATVPAGDFDIIDINKVVVEYDTLFKPVADYIKLQNVEPHQQVIVDGFSSSDISVYDVSNSREAMKYNNVVIEDLGGANFQVFFDSYPGFDNSSGTELLIIENSQFLSPSSYKIGTGIKTYLRDPSNEADFIIVGTEVLLNVAYDLHSLRESQGMKVLSLTLDQIQTEFSQGRESSLGIRDFLSYALENWNVKPKYLLILGDATYDPKDLLGNNPTISMMSVPLSRGEQTDFGSDNYYAESEDSHMPSLAIGRIPTSNEEVLADYIKKVMDYESGNRAPASGKEKLGVFISGEDQLNEGFSGEIEKLSLTLETVDQSFLTEKVHRAEEASDSDVKTKIVDQFNSGPLMMTYMGHGAENIWGSANMFANADAQSLTNNELPIVLGLNCLNNYFYDADPSVSSLGEEMIYNANGGAIAFWGSTSMTAPAAQLNLATSLMGEIGKVTSKPFQSIRLGDLMMNAKTVQGDGNASKDTIRSWTLLGDPTIRLPEKSFSPAPSDVITEGGPASTTANVEGSGGCGAVARDDGVYREPTWIEVFRESLYLLSVFMVWFLLRLSYRRRES